MRQVVEAVDLTSARSRSLGAGAVLMTAAIWPAAQAEDGPVLCPFRHLTGLPCPMCGMTRSFVYSLHGQVGDAFAAHLFGPALVLLAVAWLVTGRRHTGTWIDPRCWSSRRARPWVASVASAWLVYAVVRIVTS